MKKRILSIDPGTINAGYSIFEVFEQNLKILEIGKLSQKSSQSISSRVLKFHDFFEKKAKDFQVSTISIETPFLGKNSQTFLKLGYLRGIINLISAKNNYRLLELSPREVKTAITGSGSAKKEQVARALFSIFPSLLETKESYSDDETDALAIGLCAALENF